MVFQITMNWNSWGEESGKMKKVKDGKHSNFDFCA